MISKGKIAVVGLWHLGETVLASLSSMGHEVVGIDYDAGLINNYKKGIIPVSEKGVKEAIKKHKKKISFTTDFSQVSFCEYIFLTYDTPVTEMDESDTSVLYKAMNEVKEYVNEKQLLVVMSQVPVGTTKKLANIINTDYVYFPENLQLSKAMDCFLKPDRLVVGTDTDKARRKFASLIKKIKTKKIYMGTNSAEMSKHALNAFLATSLSFTYNISDLCESNGADIKEVMTALKADSRIGEKAYLDTSLGFSGGTLMRDLKTLVSLSKEKLPVIEAVIETNENRRKKIIKGFKKALNKPINKATIGILGVTYKPGTSTVRRSLALEVALRLKKEGAKIKVYDPGVNQKELISVLGKRGEKSIYQMAKDCHGIILVTSWSEFENLNLNKLKKNMKSPYLFFDTRNFLKHKKLEFGKLGYLYKGLGY